MPNYFIAVVFVIIMYYFVLKPESILEIKKKHPFFIVHDFKEIYLLQNFFQLLNLIKSERACRNIYMFRNTSVYSKQDLAQTKNPEISFQQA